MRHNDRRQSGQRAMLTHNWELELELCLDVADESSGSRFFSGFLAQVFTWDCAWDCASELALSIGGCGGQC